jgi:hypothetical protein
MTSLMICASRLGAISVAEPSIVEVHNHTMADRRKFELIRCGEQ